LESFIGNKLLSIFLTDLSSLLFVAGVVGISVFVDIFMRLSLLFGLAAYYLKSSLFMYLPPLTLAYSASFSCKIRSKACFSTSNFFISVYFYSFFFTSIAA
jgi:hypothetical protein